MHFITPLTIAAWNLVALAVDTSVSDDGKSVERPVKDNKKDTPNRIGGVNADAGKTPGSSHRR